MIKIYSIKEMVEASNKILNYTKVDSRKNKLQGSKKIKTVQTKQKQENYVEPLVLKSEVSQEKLLIKNFKTSQKINSITKTHSDEKKIQIVNELFNLFNKKVKKSTNKIIIEQQNEIKQLKNNLAELRKSEYKNLRINKE